VLTKRVTKLSNYDPNIDSAPTRDFSNTDNAESDAVSNRSGGGYKDKDAATETGASGRETARALHEARNDSGARDS
jgi:hypothetical protein